MKHLYSNLYVLMLSLSLALHVYNGGGDGLKPFHFTALFACFLSIKFIPKKGQLYKFVTWFFVSSFVSAAISLATPTFPGWLTMFIVIFSCFGMSYVDIDKVLNWMIVLLPIDILVLCRFAVVEPDFRFKAYYSDPNYMCTTLLCFLFICIMIYLKRNNLIIKGVMIVMMVIIGALVTLTISRTGIFCATLMILAISYTALKRHIFKLIIVAVIGVFAVQRYASEFVGEQWKLFLDRTFESNDSFENAGDDRLTLSMQNVYFIFDHPQYILFGMGPGTVHPDKASQIPGLSAYRIKDLTDHNTWTSFFSEQGLLAVSCVFLIVLTTFKAIKRSPTDSSKYLRYAFFFSLVLSSLSIQQKTFLPFWWSLFLLNNKKLQSI